MFEQLNFRVNFNNADFKEMLIPNQDKMILRHLAKKVADLADLPVMEERRQLWKDHNALGKTRPVVLCDPENGWNEIIPEKDIQCTNSIARHWEDHLRKQIFWGERMEDDYVVEAIFSVPYKYDDIQWGIQGSDKFATVKKTAEDGKAYHIETILEDYSMTDRITRPLLDINYPQSYKVLEQAHHIFDDILHVKLNTVWIWSFGLTDDYVFLRGLEKMMFDFVDEPESVHKVMKIVHESMMDRMDFLEANNLFCMNNDSSFVGSGGMGYIDGVMPAKDFQGNVRTKDMWGLAESQVTVGVSPEMFKEFIFPYQIKLMERFALTSYGCCEPMDDRFEIVKQVKNLRRISVSPWADKQIMAEKLGHDYIYSMKPSPSMIAVKEIDEDNIRKEIRKYLEITKNNCVEIVMKDNHTLGNNPENIVRWTRILKEEIGNM